MVCPRSHSGWADCEPRQAGCCACPLHTGPHWLCDWPLGLAQNCRMPPAGHQQAVLRSCAFQRSALVLQGPHLPAVLPGSPQASSFLSCPLHVICWSQLLYVCLSGCPLCSPPGPLRPSPRGSCCELLAFFPADPPAFCSLPQWCLVKVNNITRHNWAVSPVKEVSLTPPISCFSSRVPVCWPHGVVGPMGHTGEWGVPAQPEATGHTRYGGQGAASSPRTPHKCGRVLPEGFPFLAQWLIHFPGNWSLRPQPLMLGRKIFHALGPAHLLVGDRASCWPGPTSVSLALPPFLPLVLM